jgi:hypothetical protein
MKRTLLPTEEEDSTVVIDLRGSSSEIPRSKSEENAALVKVDPKESDAVTEEALDASLDQDEEDDDMEQYDDCPGCTDVYRSGDNLFFVKGEPKVFDDAKEERKALEARAKRRGKNFYVCDYGTLHNRSDVEDLKNAREEDEEEEEETDD